MGIKQPRSIREQDPLKQGLKRVCNDVVKDMQSIREQDPLKQGLKLTVFVSGSASPFNS